jgi:hypothetical protein
VKTIFLEQDGVGVKLHITPSTVIVEAAAGPFMTPFRMRQTHAGLLDGLDFPEQTSLAKSLIREAVDKVMHRTPHEALTARRAPADRRVIFFKSM